MVPTTRECAAATSLASLRFDGIANSTPGVGVINVPVVLIVKADIVTDSASGDGLERYVARRIVPVQWSEGLPGREVAMLSQDPSFGEFE